MAFSTAEEEKLRKQLNDFKEAIKSAKGDTEKLDQIRSEMSKMMGEITEKNKDTDKRETEYVGEGASYSKSAIRKGGLNYVNSIRKGQAGYNDEIEQLQKMNDSIFVQGKIMSVVRQTKYEDEVAKLAMFEQWKEHKLHTQLRKALDTTGAAPWIPTGFSPQLTERVRLDLKVVQLFREFNMPTDPWTRPIEGVDGIAHLVAESTSDDVNNDASKARPSALTVQNVTFNASKLGVRATFNEEVNEDSIIDVAEYFQVKVAQGMVNAFENATLNGSTAGTHPDNDVQTDPNTSERNERAWNGLRQLIQDAGAGGGAQFVDAGGTLDQTDIRNARLSMGKYGVNVNDLAIIVSPKGWFLLMDETNFPNVQTRDKFGDAAVILTGELAKIDGIPVVISEFQRDDVATTGFNTAAGPNTFSTLAIVNRATIEHGSRRDVKMNVTFNGETDKTGVSAFARRDMQIVQAATETYIAGVRNFS